MTIVGHKMGAPKAQGFSVLVYATRLFATNGRVMHNHGISSRLNSGKLRLTCGPYMTPDAIDKAADIIATNVDTTVNIKTPKGSTILYRTVAPLQLSLLTIVASILKHWFCTAYYR
jgi:hypothetical protein